MKFTELQTGVTYWTNTADRNVEEGAAVVVDLDEQWATSEKRYSRFPGKLVRPSADLGYQRRLPVVFVRWMKYTHEGDAAKRAKLPAAAAFARTQLALGTEVDEVAKAVHERFAPVSFALTRAQVIECTWDEHEQNEAAHEAAGELRKREQERAHATELAYHDAVVDVVQAAFGITPGTEGGGRPFDAPGRKLPYHVDAPHLHSDHSRKTRPIELSWEELAAIVTAAQEHGARAARAGEDVESAGWALREIAQRRAPVPRIPVVAPVAVEPETVDAP